MDLHLDWRHVLAMRVTLLVIVVLVIASAYSYYFIKEPSECAKPPLPWPIGCYAEGPETSTCLKEQPSASSCQTLDLAAFALVFLVFYAITALFINLTKQAED